MPERSSRSMRRLMMRMPTSMAALATALVAGSAYAQTAGPTLSYNAPNPIVKSGNVTWDRGVTTPGTEVYTVNTPTAVLDFTPSDTGTGGGPINFQNAGTFVYYKNGPSNQNFTILNRIVPNDQTRAIQFNGTVISQLQSVTGAVSPGGTVWFYSPGGILIGKSAVFNVGSLLLTAADPTGGTGVISSTSSFSVGGKTGTGITVAPGAKITASANGSYIAMVAPIIDQGGTIRVNGSAAFVAAEQAQLTINNGLFDIAVTVGTDSGGGTPFSFTGTATGPASSGPTDPHAIYMVAVPKNNAITMLIAPTGDLGFDVASSASVENGQVVLSAGYNIVSGGFDPNGPASTTAASVDLNSGRYTSDTFVRATQWGLVGATGLSPKFLGSLNIDAGQAAQVISRQNGGTIDIAGDLTLITDGVATFDPNGGFATVNGGNAGLLASNGATIHVGGSTTIQSNVNALPFGGTATAGFAGITADNGTVKLDGVLEMSADAIGTSSNGLAASLTGGIVSIAASNGGIVSVGAQTTMTANATGNFGAGGPAGSATGGNVSITTDTANGGGAIDLFGDVTLQANATGSGNSGADNFAGDGTGGSILVRSGRDPIRFHGYLSAIASGTGGNGNGGAAAGAGQGGTIDILSSVGGNLDIATYAALSAYARGGDGSADGKGSNGTGGTVLIQSDGTMHIGSYVNANAYAFGGTISGATSGVAGDGIGGFATVRAGAGGLTIDGNLTIDASGFGGGANYNQAVDGGTGIGGGARLDVTGTTGVLIVDGKTQINADGYGGQGGVTAGTTGGAGFGGVPTDQANNNYDYGAYIVAQRGTLHLVGDTSISAAGVGGSGASGGDGTGGFSNIAGLDGNVVIDGFTTGTASGTGGGAISSVDFDIGGGDGGNGTGGQMIVGTYSPNGTLGSVTIQGGNFSADGTGADGGDGYRGDGGRGGDGTGGNVSLVGDASTGGVFAGDVELDALGTGGAGGRGTTGGTGATGFAGGRGGDATGGTASIGIISGADDPANTATANYGNVSLFVDAKAGAGGAGGMGGTGRDAVENGDAGGQGGDGGTGGDGGVAKGGVGFVYARGVQVNGGNVTVSATGIGGDAGVGGDGGDGGQGGPADPNNNIPAGNNGLSGGGGTFGTGGNGQGGEFGLFATNRSGRTERGTLFLGDVAIDTTGFGGQFGGEGIVGDGALQIANGDATFNSLSWTNDQGDPGSLQPGISLEVTNGTLQAGDFLNVHTNGDMSFNVHDGGVLRATDVTLFGTGSLLAADPAVALGLPGQIAIKGDFDAEFGGDVTVNAPIDAGGNVTVTGQAITTLDIGAGGFVHLIGGSIDAGAVTRSSDIVFNADNGNVVSNDLTTSGSAFLTASLGSISIGSVSAGNSIILDALGGAASGDLTAGLNGYTGPGSGLVDVEADTGNLQAGNISGIEISLTQGIAGGGSFGGIFAGDLAAEKITVTGVGTINLGNVIASDAYSGYVAPDDGLQLVISGDGDVQVGNVTSQDTLIIGSRNGSVTAGDLFTPASAAVIAAGDINLGGVTTGTGLGDALFIGNSSILNDPLVAPYDPEFEDNGQPFDRSLLLRLTPARLGGNFTSTGTINTGTLRIAAQGISLAGVVASRKVDLDATGVASFSGVVDAPEIDVASGDIDIDLNGALGTANTQGLNLTANTIDDPVYIGGTPDTSRGYVLDKNEATRLHAAAITISAGPSAGDVAIGDLALIGSAGGANANLIGSKARFTINGGTMLVSGAVTISNTADSDILALNASRMIGVATDSGGSITLTGGQNGGLAGTLSFAAPVIAVASNAILTKMESDPRYAGLANDLATPTGTPKIEGYIQAGRLAFTVGNVLAIQNSGTTGLDAGFTAGPGGMTITALPNTNNPSGTPPLVDIYGRVAGQDGYLVNLDTFGAITFGPQLTAFDARSTVNGCPIGTDCTQPPPDTGPGGDQPGTISATVVALEKVLASDPGHPFQIPEIRFDRIVDQDGLISDPVITEPVSGAGNPSLWEGTDRQGSSEGGK